MNNNNVFNCPICWLKYDKLIRLPITLSCGHVICKLCINSLMINANTLICSLDKNTITVDPNNLPICYTIIDHMPEDQSSEFVCKLHPNKRIKYSCSNDNENLCSKCVREHKKNHHEIINFFPKKSTIEDEINLIKKHIEEKQINISIQNKKYSEIKQKLIENLKQQLDFLDSEASYLINSIKKAKELLEENIKNFCKNQLDGIDESKKCFNNSLNNLSQMLTSTMRISQMLESKEFLVYDDVIEGKKKVINDWEIFVKNYKLPCTNFYLPITKLNKSKLHNLENELFSFSTVNFSEMNHNLKSSSSTGYNINPTISTSQTPCNSNSKNFFLQSNFSTNANTINNSKYTSNRKHHSPEQMDSQKISTINFYGGSPKILSTQYSGNIHNNCNSNGSVEKLLNNINNNHHNIQTAIINANPNINTFIVTNNPTPIIGNPNPRNFSPNLTNLIFNKEVSNVFNNNLNGIVINESNNNHLKNNAKQELKIHKNIKPLEEKDTKHTGGLKSKEKEKPKRANSNVIRKFNNKQLQIIINPNLIPNTNRNSVLNVPSTTNTKNTKSININTKNKIQSNKVEDSNESIRDIIRNLNEEKLFSNFNRKTERPISFRFSDKIKKMDSANVIYLFNFLFIFKAPVKINHNNIENLEEIVDQENSKLNKSF